MALQSSVAARNAEADAWTTSVGNGAKIRLYSRHAARRRCRGHHRHTACWVDPEHHRSLRLRLVALSRPRCLPLSQHQQAARPPTGACTKAMERRRYFRGTAGTSGTDMILDSATIASGVPTYITAWTMTPGGA